MWTCEDERHQTIKVVIVAGQKTKQNETSRISYKHFHTMLANSSPSSSQATPPGL